MKELTIIDFVSVYKDWAGCGLYGSIQEVTG